MSKPWHEKPLWWKVFMAADEVYLHAGKIIGHLGCSPFEFFDAAKLLPDYNQHRYENAVRDLTVYAKREASPPRYELTDRAKKVLWIIIGPPPDHPEYQKWWEGRLVSVRQMRAEGIPVRWAEEPPVPLESAEKPAKPKKEARRRKAQTLARHSTITLTMDRYAHTGLKDIAAAFESLPSLNSKPKSEDDPRPDSANGSSTTGANSGCTAPCPQGARAGIRGHQRRGKGQQTGDAANC